MAKHTLLVEYDCDFELIGISCHLKDYRFCWLLNLLLDLNLEKDPEGITTESGVFTMYSILFQDTETKLCLIVNRSSKGYFSAEHREADYLMVLQNNSLYDVNEIIDILNSNSSIIMAYTIDVEKLKPKEYLLFNDI